MHQQRIDYLFQKYFDKSANDLEIEELMQYIDTVISSNSTEEFFPPGKRDEFLQAIFKEKTPEPVEISPKWKWYKKSTIKYTAAAALLLIVGATAILMNRSELPHTDIITSAINPVNIKPAENKTTLTLDDGSVISLNEVENGKIADQAGIIITKTEDGKLLYSIKESAITDNNNIVPVHNTISTPSGGQFQVLLPDGTKVWLNAMSSLKYPVQFSENERVVELIGEAYFEVAKNTRQPFKVVTDHQIVRVLGTHFNINSYKGNEFIKTTLLEGSVKVIGLDNDNSKALKSILLKPGQQASLNSTTPIKVKNVNIEHAIAWKSGLFQFENTNIKDVMQEFSRWYDVDVEYDKGVPDITLWGRIYRTVNAAEALEILSYFNLKYKVVQTTNSKTNHTRKKIIVSYN